MQTRGFTLIELLVVIGIITGLALVGVSTLDSTRAKARDAKRIADVRQIQAALHLYYSDHNEFPITDGALILGSVSAAQLCDKASGGFVAAASTCSSVYMQALPTDPLPGARYTYTGSATGFDVMFTTESSGYLGASGTYHAHTQTIDSRPGNY